MRDASFVFRLSSSLLHIRLINDIPVCKIKLAPALANKEGFQLVERSGISRLRLVLVQESPALVEFDNPLVSRVGDI